MERSVIKGRRASFQEEQLQVNPRHLMHIKPDRMFPNQRLFVSSRWRQTTGYRWGAQAPPENIKQYFYKVGILGLSNCLRPFHFLSKNYYFLSNLYTPNMGLTLTTRRSRVVFSPDWACQVSLETPSFALF